MSVFNNEDNYTKAFILARLPLPEMVKFCKLNKQYHNICTDVELSELVFFERLKREFPQYLKYRPKGIHAKKFYIRVYEVVRNPIFAEYYAARGLLPEMKIVIDLGNDIPKFNYDIVNCENQLDVVKFLISQGAKPTRQLTFKAIRKNCVDVLKFLYEYGIRYLSDDELAEKSLSFVSFMEDDTYFAARDGNLEAFKFLESIGVPVIERAFNGAVKQNKTNIVRYLLTKNITPSVEAIDYAATKGYLHVIQLLARNGFLPSEVGVRGAQRNDHYDVVEFLENFNFYFVFV